MARSKIKSVISSCLLAGILTSCPPSIRGFRGHRVVAVALASIKGFAPHEAAEIRSALEQQLSRKFAGDEYVQILEVKADTPQTELLQRSWERQAYSAALVDLAKDESSHDVIARLSVFERAESLPSKDNLDGVIRSPESVQNAFELPGHERQYRTDIWGNPFVIQTMFEPLGNLSAHLEKYVQSIATTIGGWLSGIVRYLEEGMVSVNLTVFTKPGNTELLWISDEEIQRLGSSSDKGVFHDEFFRYPGNYTLKVMQEGYFEETKGVTVAPAKNPPFSFRFTLKRNKHPLNQPKPRSQ
jgi:hypothetical protein